MKTRFSGITGALAAILLIASFVIPVCVATTSGVSADPGVMRWDTIITPNLLPLKNDIDNVHFPGIIGVDNPMGSEIISMAVGNDGQTIAWIVRDFEYADPHYPPLYGNLLYWSNTSGIAATPTRELGLRRAVGFTLGIGNPLLNPINGGNNGLPSNCYQVVIAPDNPACMAVSTDGTTGGAFGTGWAGGPKRIYFTSDAGNTWDLAYDGSTALGATEFIRNMDISIDYGGKRDIGFVTTTGTGTGRWFVRSSSGFNNWQNQNVAPSIVMPAGVGGTQAFDFYAIKFSPTYNGDSSVALIAADFTGTYYNVATRDINQNYTTGWAFNNSINVMNVADLPKSSPTIVTLNNAVLQLPSDFSGQSSSLRRAYISLDSFPAFGGPKVTQDGIYRVDDTTIYVLMDTAQSSLKSIYSIAYYGTYASGKLLAGERQGFPCTATVPTWFTDSPTTCPIPCWYPALKPTTGAGDQAGCSTGENGVGAAIVGWNADGSLGLVSTGSLAVLPSVTPVPALPPFGIVGLGGGGWWILHAIYGVPVHDDESAFAISRNNGETWNQLALIDTTIDWFNDVAVAPDCTTIYLASVSANTGIGCNEFDSVWRSTLNPNVAAPLPPATPIGIYWERVFTHTTSGGCNIMQSELPILRVVESCTDKPTGEIVGWAAQHATATTATNSGGVMAWSPDYGDYWATVTPRYPVQDFTFESSTTMYVL
ncbi:MAG: hypothetical protein ACYDHZ_11380, partial [Dehalococcoidia bacterium]